MTIKDFYTAVAAEADSDTQKIGAAEVSRVLSVAFMILAKARCRDRDRANRQGTGERREEERESGEVSRS